MAQDLNLSPIPPLDLPPLYTFKIEVLGLKEHWRQSPGMVLLMAIMIFGSLAFLLLLVLGNAFDDPSEPLLHYLQSGYKYFFILMGLYLLALFNRNRGKRLELFEHGLAVKSSTLNLLFINYQDLASVKALSPEETKAAKFNSDFKWLTISPNNNVNLETVKGLNYVLALPEQEEFLRRISGLASLRLEQGKWIKPRQLGREKNPGPPEIEAILDEFFDLLTNWEKEHGQPVFSAPLPSRIDEEFKQLTGQYERASKEKRRFLEQGVQNRNWRVFLKLSVRLASLGVRGNSRREIELGLMGVLMAFADNHECFRAMAPLYDAALRVGLDAPAIFRLNFNLAPPEVRQQNEEFLTSPDLDRILEIMSFEVAGGNEEFEYFPSPKHPWGRARKAAPLPRWGG